MSDIADILDRAADLIEPEGAWTQNVLARHDNGNPAYYGSPSAVCWCALGATGRIAGDKSIEADSFFRAFLGVEDIGGWNDAPERTQAEVVAKLREAAAKARSQVPA